MQFTRLYRGGIGLGLQLLQVEKKTAPLVHLLCNQSTFFPVGLCIQNRNTNISATITSSSFSRFASVNTEIGDFNEMSHRPLVDIEDGIMTITFNVPKKKNAISADVMSEFKNILDEAASNDSVDFVILTGAGDYYSSGADLSGPANLSLDPIIVGREFVASFIDFPKLLIAIVNGPAVGVAVSTLALCDMVYCSTQATFVVPFCLHGLCAEGCSSYLFPRIMGPARANEILQFGRKFTAAEAKEWGLVTEVYKPEELKSVLMPLLRKMQTSLVQQSIRVNKSLIRRWNSKVLHEVNAAEWKELESRLLSPEFVSALMRFAERKQAGNKL